MPTKRTPTKRKAAKRTPRKARAARVAKATKQTPRLATGNGMTPTFISKGIGRYLDECRLAGARGLRPMERRSTEKIEAHLDKLDAKIGEGVSTIVELGMRNQMLALRGELNMREQTNGTSSAEFFIEHASDFAKRKGIAYGAFRAMGVPAPVLKEAGITR